MSSQGEAARLAQLLLPAKERRGAVRWGLFLACLVTLATACAVFTFFQFNTVLAVPGEQVGRAPLHGLLAILLFLLLVTSPVISLFAAVAPLPGRLAALKLHAAAVTCLLVVLRVVPSPGNSFGDPFTSLIHFVQYVVLAAELAAMMYAEGRIREEFGRWAQPRLLYKGLTASVLGGCLTGGVAWSLTIPPRVIAGAEAEAGELPYCLMVNGRPARGWTDLTGWRMWSPRQRHGMAGNYHGMLVVEAPTGRRHLNWSYRTNGFQPIPDRRVRSLNLDRQPLCEPTPHAARGWR